jgi:alkanesulfonate monooxygenase SsuD/methylene tetrahydromethanopterin reductase-like flavin-dependent oxidoreductase (luciferase family)
MEVGIVIPTFDRYANSTEFRRVVEQLESLGFDSAWFGDHIVFPTWVIPGSTRWRRPMSGSA